MSKINNEILWFWHPIIYDSTDRREAISSHEYGKHNDFDIR